MGSSSKSGSAGGSKQYNYYGSFAGLVLKGPVDGLLSIVADNKECWAGPLDLSGSPNPAPLMLETYGAADFLRGRSDQIDVHPLLQAAGNDSGDDHPAYTDLAVLVLKDILFGRETQNAPNFQVRGWRKPRQTVITGAAAELDADYQANPFCVAAELLQDEWLGLNLPRSAFNVSTWQAAADAAYAKKERCYVSVFLNNQSTAKSILADLLVMCDGWVRADHITGACEAGVFPAPESIDPSSLPLIDMRSLIDPPMWNPESWDDVYTDWTVVFTDRTRNFQNNASLHTEPNALINVGFSRPQTLQRPYVTRQSQADAYAQEWGRRYGLPGGTFQLGVRSELVKDVRPGSHIVADADTQPGGLEEQQVCRVETLTRSIDGKTIIKGSIERTLEPITVAAPTSPEVPPPPPEVPEIDYARFFEVTVELGGKNFVIATLASRPAKLVTDFSVWYDRDAGGFFPRIGLARTYGLRARVNTAIASGDIGPFSIELLDANNREIIADDVGDAASRDDTLLMIVLKIAGSGQIQADGDNKAWIEIYSCNSFVATGANLVAVTALRARQGTTAHDFAVHDEVWFISRANLTLLDHADFAGLAAANQPAYFKLQPATSDSERALADCVLRSFSFALNRDVAPDGESTYIEVRYKRSNLVPATPTGDNPAGWTLTSPSGSGAVWASQATRSGVTNHVIGSWSTPTRISGTIVFFQGSAPAPASFDLKQDDTWFDIDDDNRLYRWDGSAWVPAFAPMLTFADGDKIYGLQKAGSSETAFVLVADRFQIWDGSSSDAPFEIVDGSVYIKDAFIRSVRAGAITAGTIEVALKLTAVDFAAGKIATGATRYNAENDQKLMPFIGRGSTDLAGGGIDATSLDESVGVSVYTDANLTFEGWLHGADGMVQRRFGTSPAWFQFLVTGNGSCTSGRIGIEMMYRVNGGAWISCSAHNVCEGLYGNISLPWLFPVTLAGTDTIDFGVSLNKDSGTVGSIGELKVSVACLND